MKVVRTETHSKEIHLDLDIGFPTQMDAPGAPGLGIRKSLKQIFRSNFFTRLTNWEYWPFSLIYFPVSFYWIWLIIKARSLFFFTASNPSIEFGGMLGESKFDIFKLINPSLQPKTIFSPPDRPYEQILATLRSTEMDFPLIAKPDVGERGWMVEKINNELELKKYWENTKVNLLLQEYIDLPVELGVFYYRFPNETKGTISSVVYKQFLEVKGDGDSSLKELILTNPRAKLQFDSLEQSHGDQFDYVPLKNEVIPLVPSGNHCRGTTFFSGNHLINEHMISVFDNIACKIDGFYFGRFDIRCESIEELYQGKNFKILELNGAGSEPSHIYHPGFPLSSAYSVIFHHLNVLYKISKMNKKRGIPYMSFIEGMKMVKKIRNYKKLQTSNP